MKMSSIIKHSCLRSFLQKDLATAFPVTEWRSLLKHRHWVTYSEFLKHVDVRPFINFSYLQQPFKAWFLNSDYIW
jgi:hypothetical protein